MAPETHLSNRIPEVFALFDDCTATPAQPSSRLYTGFLRQHVCTEPLSFDAIWATVADELQSGAHAVLLCDYEWGVKLLQAGLERPACNNSSLRFLMFSRMDRLSRDEVDAWLADSGGGIDDSPSMSAKCFDFKVSVTADEFERAVCSIKNAIREGETYQVNYTYRMDFTLSGEPQMLYRHLRKRQPVAYGAFLKLPPGNGPSHVLSCSPELFVRHASGKITAKPMKGTAPFDQHERGGERKRLQLDPKNRAENLMIVDLLRNDLGRVAELGSVNVSALFEVERCGSVLQMTSTIDARVRQGTSFPDLWRALFPCGSITGAPKHRTMDLISRCESTPRGLYTGAIGWIEGANRPNAALAFGDFCCSVAIRTVTLAPASENQWRGQLGVGAGITSDSVPEDEYAECQLKARFLSDLETDEYR